MFTKRKTATETPTTQPVQPEAGKRRRGRPAMRDPSTKTYSMTLRIKGPLRLDLRHEADLRTGELGRVCTVHDVILEALQSHLAAKRRERAGEATILEKIADTLRANGYR